MKNDETIDIWYEEAKDVAFKSYIEAIGNHVDEQRREQAFLQAMKKIHSQYDKHHQRLTFRLKTFSLLKHYFLIIAWPFLNLWKLITFLFLQLWTFLKKSCKAFSLWYRHGPKLARETRKYMKKTRSEMCLLPKKKKWGSRLHPIFFAIKRPTRRQFQSFVTVLMRLLSNLKTNTIHYWEQTVKGCSATWNAYLKVQEILVKHLQFTKTIIHKIVSSPKLALGWLKEKLGPEEGI